MLRGKEWRESVRSTTTRKHRKVLRGQLAISPVMSGELRSMFDIDWYDGVPWEALPKAIRNYRKALRHSSVKWLDEERAVLKRSCIKSLWERT